MVAIFTDCLNGGNLLNPRAHAKIYPLPLIKAKGFRGNFWASAQLHSGVLDQVLDVIVDTPHACGGNSHLRNQNTCTRVCKYILIYV